MPENEQKTYTFTATLSDGIPDLDCEPVRDTIDVLDEKLRNTNMTLEAVAELTGVDPEALKEKMIIKALTNLTEGYGSGYVGDLNADTLELIEKLKTERDKAEESLRRYKYFYEQEHEKLKKACDVLKQNRFIDVPLYSKRRYSAQELKTVVERIMLEHKRVITELGGLLH